MTLVCSRCRALVEDDLDQCPSCGALMDLGATIMPPKFQSVAAPTAPPRTEPEPPTPTPVSPSARRREPIDEPDAPSPRAEAPRAPRPRPAAPPPEKPRKPRPPSSVAQPTKPQPQPHQSPPAPAPQPQPPAYYPSQPPPGHYPGPPGARPSGLRGMLIKMLGGEAAPAPGGPAPMPPAAGYPGYGAAPAAPGYPYAAPPPAPAPAPPPPAAPASEASGVPVTPPHAVPLHDEEEDDGLRTRAMSGVRPDQFRIPTSLLALQILDCHGKWHDWAMIGASGLKVGRSERTAQFPELNSMAARHLRISPSGAKVVVEDLGALNGVYLKITGPVELEDGRRFRLSTQVLEFRKAEPLPTPEPLVGPDGEEFWSRDRDALAYLDFIRSDNKPGLRFPILRRDLTLIGSGRPGKPVDIALGDDEWISGHHAQVRHQDGAFFLEDLNSRNGTFVQIRGTTTVEPGDVLLVGRVQLRAIDPRRA